MKNYFTNLLSGLALLSACAVSSAAMAQSSAPTPIKSGETASCNVKYVFTATSTGMLEISSNTFTMFGALLYPDASCALFTEIPAYSVVQGKSGNDYYFKVEEGTDYYFYLEYVTLGGNFNPKFTFKELGEDIPNTVTFIYPVPDVTSAYPLSSSPNLDVSFFIQGRLSGDASIVYTTVDGGQASTPVYYEAVEKDRGLVYEFGVKAALAGVKSNIKDKSNFTVKVASPAVDGVPVTGQYVDADGNLAFTYNYLAQTSVVNAEWPDPFLSFWPENSSDGVMKFVFDGPLAPQAQQTELTFDIFAGKRPDSGDEWPRLPGAPVTIEGNTLTVDLRGVVRLTDKNVVSVHINNIYAADGQFVDFFGSGAIHLDDIPYVAIREADLEYEFTPDGGSLEGINRIELWVGADSFKHVSIDGFRFSANGIETIEVPLSASNPTEDTLDPGSMIYTIPVQSSLQNVTNLTLSAMLTSLDGYTYTLQKVFNADSGVNAVLLENGEAAVFDLHGRRVAHPQQGIYIVKGKLVKF